MEAKDTVMSKGKLLDKFGVALNENILNRDERLGVVAKAQAEISFKVGKTAGVAESLIPAVKAIEDSRKAGIREAVEWMKKQRTTPLGKDYYGYYIWEAQLEAKLKEWGLS